MFAARVVSASLDILNRSYLAMHPYDGGTLPPPEPNNKYVLYAHVPFCERLCTYCSFNRFLFNEDRARFYFTHLREEMRMVADLGYQFKSLYIGGGTPTILLDELASTIDLARMLFPRIGEVSAETAPNHLGKELVSALDGRVQRLSVGVQSFDDSLLRQMDRFGKYGSGQEVFDRVASVADAFPSFNVDMIFNFPSQTEEVLRSDIELVKQIGANQTTFYPLMASPLRRKELAATVGRIDFGKEERFYKIIGEALAPEFEPASAWTFSRDRDVMIDEYIVDFPEYVGIGSGAMSFLRGTMWGNTFSLAEYSEAIESGQLAVVRRGDRYSRKALMRYRFVTDLFGLRLDKAAFKRAFGVDVNVGLFAELAFLRLAGAIERETDTEITLTQRGRYLLLVMMRETLAASNDARDKAREALPPEERVLLLEGDAAYEALLAQASGASA